MVGTLGSMLMRFALADRDAGPSGLLLQPLTGEHSTRDEHHH